MNATVCPSPETLRDYLAGKLSDQASKVLESHMNSCESCEDTANHLEQEPDTFAEFLNRSDDPAELPGEQLSWFSLGPARELIDRVGSSFEPTSQINTTVGSYDILDRLGRGGMGAVYLARHRELHKTVAIKLLPKLAAEKDEVVARFRREMRAAGRLEHPAIVKATDAGEVGGIHFLVMEVAEGLDVGRVARWMAPLSIADACDIIRQTAMGLEHAHEQGIVHRDIKPSNLMLGHDGRVKILDFGLAQVNYWEEAKAELTSVGQLMGTLDYMAPEQCSRGGKVDARADIYSLGATFFKLLTGASPLASDRDLSPLEKLRLLSEHKLRALGDLRSEVPAELTQLVESMLATEPGERPASAREVAQQIEQFSHRGQLKSDLSLLVRRTEQLSRDEVISRSPSVGLPVPAESEPSDSDTVRRRLWPWTLTAGLSVLICLAAGILLTLELTQGQLIIESENAEVSIRLLDEQDRSQELEIEPGTTITRLRDGKYEITLNEGSDQFSLSKDTFTIRRGEAIVARVTRQPTPAKTKAQVGGNPFGTDSARSRTSDSPHPENGPMAIQELDSESKILAALKHRIEPDFPGIPLAQVLAVLADELNIPIWINVPQLEREGVHPDTPITLQLPPVSLRSALHLMLEPLGLTYTVRNEVLEITSKDNAEVPFVQIGDTLAVYIESVIPMHVEPSQLLPTPVFQAGTRHPVQGLPFRVNSQGRITLPLIGEIQVADRRLMEVAQIIKHAYVDGGVLAETEQRKIVISVDFLLRAGESLEIKNLTENSN